MAIGSLVAAAYCFVQTFQGIFLGHAAVGLDPTFTNTPEITGHAAVIVGLRWMGGGLALVCLAWLFWKFASDD